MCAGASFSGTFHNCTFDVTSIYVVHGASADFRDCTWKNCHTGIVTHGPSTAATASHSTITGSRFCVIAEAGASVALRSCNLASYGSPVVVHDAGTHVSVSDCLLRGVTVAPCDVPSATGVRLHGGSARLRRCGISGFATGAIADGRSASLEMHSSHIAAARACHVADHARSTLRDIRMHAVNEPMVPSLQRAPLVCATRAGPQRGGACLQLSRCEMRSSVAEKSAVEVAHGGRVAMLLCHMRSDRSVAAGRFETTGRAVVMHCRGNSRTVGCCVTTAGAVLRVEGGVMASQGSACMAAEEGSLVLVDVRVSGGVTQPSGGTYVPFIGAVTASMGATARILRCHLHDSVAGVHVIESRVRVVNSCISDMTLLPCVKALRAQPRMSSGYICEGGHLDIEGGSVKNCTFGLDVHMTESKAGECLECGTARVHGVVFSGYARGMQVMPRCAGEVVRCEFAGHAGMSEANRDSLAMLQPTDCALPLECGLMFCGVAAGYVRECSFRKTTLGMHVTAAEPVLAVDCAGSGGGVKERARDEDERPGDEKAAEGDVEVEGALDHGSNGNSPGGVVIVVEDCTFADMKAAFRGVHSHTTLRRCTMVEGMSLGVVSCGAELLVLDCKVRVVTFGVVVIGGGLVRAVTSLIEGDQAAMDIGVDGGTIRGDRVTARGGRYAVHAVHTVTPPAECAAAGVPIRRERMTLKLIDCVLEAREGVAVDVGGMQTQAELLRCDVRGLVIGVSVQAGGNVTVVESTVAGGDRGIDVGEDGADLEMRCQDCGRQGMAASEAAWKTMCDWAARGPPGGHKTLPIRRSARCAHEGARASAALDDVEVRDCRMGVTVWMNGQIAAERVRLWGCGVGILVVEVAGIVGNRFNKCTVWEAPGARGLLGLRQFGPRDGDVTDAGVYVPGVEVEYV